MSDVVQPNVGLIQPYLPPLSYQNRVFVLFRSIFLLFRVNTQFSSHLRLMKVTSHHDTEADIGVSVLPKL